jgi:hypothetical protein
VASIDPTPSEEAASPASTHRGTLELRPLKEGVHKHGLRIDESTLTGSIKRTVEGPSELTLQVHDPGWAVLNSGLFQTDLSGRFDQPIDIQIGPLWFRLVKISPSGETLTLLFEDREVALLREQDYKIVVDRTTSTMAEFAYSLIMVPRDDQGRLRAWIPELHDRQAIETPKTAASSSKRKTADARRSRGLPDRIKIRGWDGAEHTLTAGETDNAETALYANDLTGAGPKATKALLMALIVEGPFFDNPVGGDASSSGSLQLLASHLGGSTSTHGGRRDIAKVCKLFQTEGFTGAGGAIDLAKNHPDWTAGQIAQAVQGSAHADRYDAVAAGAQRIIDEWAGGGGRSDGTTDRTVVKPYLYKVTGDYWTTLTTYAQAVNWRCFVSNGVVYYVSEERLFESRSRATISRTDGNITGLSFDHDVRKKVIEVSFTCRADLWAVPPGCIVTLTDAGTANGRYLVKTTQRGLDDPTTTITLSKPILKKAEASNETSTPTTSSTGSRDGGFPAGSHLAKAYTFMRSVDAKNFRYVKRGGHNASFSGPYDCSGAQSAMLHAAGLLDEAQSTSGLINWGQPGEGGHLTVWVKEIPGSPWTSHTFATMKLPSGTVVYFEAGGADSAHTGFHKARSHAGFTPRHWPGL